MEQQYKTKREKYAEEYNWGSATKHDYSEDQISLKIKKYVAQKMRETKYNAVRQMLNHVIENCYGLANADWNIFTYPEKDIESFLFSLVSLRFKDIRLIYFDKIERDTNTYNKYLLRDLRSGNLEVDVPNYCEFILRNSPNYKQPFLDNSMVMEAMKAKVSRDINDNIMTWAEVAQNVSNMIKQIKCYYFVKNKALHFSVIDIYNGICSCEEYIFTLLKKYYMKVSRYSPGAACELIELLKSLQVELERVELKKTEYKFDIFQEYAWRLLWQTTVQENRITVDLYKKMLDSPGKKDIEIDETKLSKIDLILEWFISQNYIFFPLDKITPEIYNNLYYEIFIDKTKYKNTALVIANKIIRNEYYKNGNLSGEIWFLKLKIVRAIMNLSPREYEEYAKLIITWYEDTLLVLEICKNNGYSPCIVLDLYDWGIKKWIEILKVRC